MKKTAIRIICFMIILLVVLIYINRIFELKYSDGIYNMKKFYELEKNTVDVLVLGSSHAFEDFNTGVLWDDYGMSSYILGGSVQPMWNTYYYLKEALKTQTPELIVLEGYMTVWDQEFIDDSRIIKNNFGLKWSLDKIESVKISSPKDRWKDFFLEYIQYHTRYTELKSEDFLKNQGYRLYDDWKGFGCNMETNSLESVDVSKVSDRLPLYEKTEKYYRAVLELARDKNIPIVVVISPYAGISDIEQKKFNSANDIANEYGARFINTNLLLKEMNIDYNTDAADVAHLNYRGNQKFSKYIGSYLKSNYNISSHYNDKKYKIWENDANYIKQIIKNQLVKESKDINEILKMSEDFNYWVIVSVDGNCNTSDTNLELFFKNYGINKKEENGIWIKQGKDIFWSSGNGEIKKYFSDSLHDLCMKKAKNEIGEYYNEILIDKKLYKLVVNGVNVVIYDKKTEKIVNMFGINKDNNYKIVDMFGSEKNMLNSVKSN